MKISLANIEALPPDGHFRTDNHPANWSGCSSVDSVVWVLKRNLPSQGGISRRRQEDAPPRSLQVLAWNSLFLHRGSDRRLPRLFQTPLDISGKIERKNTIRVHLALNWSPTNPTHQLGGKLNMLEHVSIFISMKRHVWEITCVYIHLRMYVQVHESANSKQAPPRPLRKCRFENCAPSGRGKSEGLFLPFDEHVFWHWSRIMNGNLRAAVGGFDLCSRTNLEKDSIITH